jgi:hypothetical protein
MVLLTSSAVSVAISGGIICIFTFLLFLSGYVLQQQSVRSLQEALRRPPEPKPTPTLPAKFQNLDNVTNTVLPKQIEQIVVAAVEGLQEPVKTDQGDKPATRAGDEEEGKTRHEEDHETSTSSMMDRPESHMTESLAYILSLPNPSDICSAVLFAKWQRQFTGLQSLPTIMFLYPTTWETMPTPKHISALTLMRDVQDEYSLTYLPVDINSARAGVAVNAQLLGELQRRRWDFDRAMYLKSPGLALDTTALDRALAMSSVRTSWAPLSASAGQDPELLLYSRRKGLMMARGDMRSLTVSAVTSHEDRDAKEIDADAAAKNAAYVLFDKEDLGHRRKEKQWHGGVFERFERERSNVCNDRGLLHDDEDKLDLRRKS